MFISCCYSLRTCHQALGAYCKKTVIAHSTIENLAHRHFSSQTTPLENQPEQLEKHCKKCRALVIPGSKICGLDSPKTPQSARSDDYDNDPTRTAYYVGDRAAADYSDMMREAFAPCLAKYPTGYTVTKKSDGSVWFTLPKD